MRKSMRALDEKVESLKQKLNTSKILKEDFLTSIPNYNGVQPRYRNYVPGASIYNSQISPKIDEVRSIIDKEISNGVMLENEIKKLQLQI